MKQLLIIALLLSGCANEYRYHQTDDGWNDNVVTTVTEIEKPVISEQMIQFFVIAAGTLAAFSMAMSAGSE